MRLTDDLISFIDGVINDGVDPPHKRNATDHFERTEYEKPLDPHPVDTTWL